MFVIGAYIPTNTVGAYAPPADSSLSSRMQRKEAAQRETTERTAKWQRPVAAILGPVALFAAFVASVYAIMAIEDFKNPAVSFWSAAGAGIIMCSMALLALDLGIRFLRFALVGKTGRKSSWIRQLLLGIACFFPGFVFSLIPAALWTKYVWPRREDNLYALLVISLCTGAAAATMGCIVQLRKRSG